MNMNWWKFSLIIVLNLSYQSEIKSCSCDLTPYDRAVQNADEIFFGQVIKVEIIDRIKPEYHEEFEKTYYSRAFVKVTFDVHKKWKGSPKRFVEIYQWTSSCMMSFDFREDYIVYASKYENSDTLTTWLCTRNADENIFKWKYYAEFYPSRYPDYYWEGDSLKYEGYDDRPRLNEDFPDAIKFVSVEAIPERKKRNYIFEFIFGLLCFILGFVIKAKK